MIPADDLFNKLSQEIKNFMLNKIHGNIVKVEKAAKELDLHTLQDIKDKILADYDTEEYKNVFRLITHRQELELIFKKVVLTKKVEAELNYFYQSDLTNDEVNNFKENIKTWASSSQFLNENILSELNKLISNLGLSNPGKLNKIKWLITDLIEENNQQHFSDMLVRVDKHTELEDFFIKHSEMKISQEAVDRVLQTLTEMQKVNNNINFEDSIKYLQRCGSSINRQNSLKFLKEFFAKQVKLYTDLVEVSDVLKKIINKPEVSQKDRLFFNNFLKFIDLYNLATSFFRDKLTGLDSLESLNIWQVDFDRNFSDKIKSVDDFFEKNKSQLNKLLIGVGLDCSSTSNMSELLKKYQVENYKSYEVAQWLTQAFVSPGMSFKEIDKHLSNLKKNTAGTAESEYINSAITWNEKNIHSYSELAGCYDKILSCADIISQLQVLIMSGGGSDELKSIDYINKYCQQIITNYDVVIDEGDKKRLKDCFKHVNSWIKTNNLTGESCKIFYTLQDSLATALNINLDDVLANRTPASDDKIDLITQFFAAPRFARDDGFNGFITKVINNLSGSEKIPALAALRRHESFNIRDVDKINQWLQASTLDKTIITSVIYVLKETKRLFDSRYLREPPKKMSFEKTSPVKEDVFLTHVDANIRDAARDFMCKEMRLHGYDHEIIKPNITYSHDKDKNFYYMHAEFTSSQNPESEEKNTRKVEIKFVPPKQESVEIYTKKTLLNRLIAIRNAALALAEQIQKTNLVPEIDDSLAKYKEFISNVKNFSIADRDYIAEFINVIHAQFEGVDCDGKKLNASLINDKLLAFEAEACNKEQWDVLGSCYLTDNNMIVTLGYPRSQVSSYSRGGFNRDGNQYTVNSYECVTAAARYDLNKKLVIDNERRFVRHGSPNTLKPENKKIDYYKNFIDNDIAFEYRQQMLAKLNALNNDSPDLAAEVKDIVEKMTDGQYKIMRTSHALLSAHEDSVFINKIYEYEKELTTKKGYSLDGVDLSLDLKDLRSGLSSSKLLSAFNQAIQSTSLLKVRVKYESISFVFAMNEAYYSPISRGPHSLERKINSNRLQKLLNKVGQSNLHAVAREINSNGLQKLLDKISQSDLEEDVSDIIKDLIQQLSPDYKLANFPFKKGFDWQNCKQKLIGKSENINLLIRLIDSMMAAEQRKNSLQYLRGSLSARMGFDTGYQKNGVITPLQHNMLSAVYSMELCANLGFKPDFFCKSGEDRTGLMHAIHESFIVDFKDFLAKQEPSLDQEQKENAYQDFLAQYFNKLWVSINGSISTTIAGQNVIGADGLQIIAYLFKNHPDTYQYLGKIFADKIGKTAKGPYADAISWRRYFSTFNPLARQFIEQANIPGNVSFKNQLTELFSEIEKNKNSSESLAPLLKKLSAILDPSNYNEFVNEDVTAIIKILHIVNNANPYELSDALELANFFREATELANDKIPVVSHSITKVAPATPVAQFKLSAVEIDDLEIIAGRTKEDFDIVKKTTKSLTKSLTITSKSQPESFSATWSKVEKKKGIDLLLSFSSDVSLKERNDIIEKQLAIYWQAKIDKKETSATFATQDNNDYVTQILLLGNFCKYINQQPEHNINLLEVKIDFHLGSLLKELGEQQKLPANFLEKIDPSMNDEKKLILNDCLKQYFSFNSKCEKMRDAFEKIRPHL